MITFWYWTCLFLLVSNIKILIDESYDLVYRIVNQNEPIQYLNCVNLGEILINKTKSINLNEIKNYVDYSLKLKQKNKKNNQSTLKLLNFNIKKILNKIKLKNYLIYQDRICFNFSNEWDFEEFNNLLINEKLFMDSTYLIFNKDTFSFLNLENANNTLFNQITIYHKEYPYSNCSKDYINFKCLNDKIKQIQRLSKYYYDSNENGSIEINYQINQTIIDNELKIIKQCNQIDCKINLLYSDNYLKPVVLKSFLNISKLDFYFQLIGLIVLFLNISIYKIMIKFSNFINSESIKMKILNLINFELIDFVCKKISNKLNLKLIRLKLLARKYLKINNLIILILLICLLVLFNRSIYNFIDERDYPIMKIISVDSIKSELSIVICIPINRIKGNDYSIYNKSLLEIENDTNNGLDNLLKDIYLDYLNIKIPTKWQLESKLVAFSYAGRCFQIRILLDEPKYQSIFSITKLVIEFSKYGYEFIFVLTDNEIFNPNSYYLTSFYNFRLEILEKSKLNKIKRCKYNFGKDDHCVSEWNCIYHCTTRAFYNQFKNITDRSFIYKNYFKEIEWSNLFFKPYSKEIYSIYRQIENKCINKYSKLDFCFNSKLERQSIINYRTSKKSEINLSHDVIYYREEEVSIFKLLLDLLNIQGNLFGLNFFSFSFMILSSFKCINLKLIKIFKLLIYLLCLIGLIYHLWSIYDEILNIEIIFSEHYELIDSIQPPDLIYCFNFNQAKLKNSNYKLTYEYLDKITSNELNENKIFSRIEYLNTTNQWIKLDKNFKDNNLEIRIFYYLNMKCFKIEQNIEYHRDQFYFNDVIDDGVILKIFFNRIYLDVKIFYLFTKTKNKIQFSKIIELNLKNRVRGFQSFEIKHETIKRDEFELIKNPLSSNDQNNLDQLFNKLINYFETKLNLVTFKLPFEKTITNSRLELDDNLFIQLYYQNEKHDSTNHLKQYSINHLKINSHENLNLITDFKFYLSFYRKVIVVSNKISLIKLIINLLNVLSFWFDLGILDISNYLLKIKFLPLQFYKLLIMIMIIIRNKLNLIIF